jgi:hypothetical protein
MSEDLPALRRGLVEGAVTDTEGTIRATDTKASIALVLHGLLFAGLLNVTMDLGRHYSAAGTPHQVATAILLGIVGLAFVGSIVQLLRCIAPAPRKVIPDTHHWSHGVFFVVDQKVGHEWKMPPISRLNERLQAMTVEHIENEWLAEVVKVSAIRARKTRLIKSGVLLLGIEVVAAVAYLAVIGISAA